MVSKFAQSWPLSESPISLDQCLQVYTFIVVMCTSKLAWIWHARVSLSLLDFGPRVHLQTPSTLTSNCISGYIQHWPPSSSRHSFNYELEGMLFGRLVLVFECISEYAQLQSPNGSLSALNLLLKVNLLSSIRNASLCVTQFDWSKSLGISYLALKHRVQPLQI